MMQGGFLSTYFLFTVFRGLSYFRCLEEYFYTQKFTDMKQKFTTLPNGLSISSIKTMFWYHLLTNLPCCSSVPVFRCFFFLFSFLISFFSFFLNRFLLHVENRLPLYPIFCHERLIFLQRKKNVLLFWHFVSLDMVWKPNNTLKTCFSRIETQESSFLFILFNYCKTPSKANTSWLQWKVFSKTEE